MESEKYSDSKENSMANSLDILVRHNMVETKAAMVDNQAIRQEVPTSLTDHLPMARRTSRVSQGPVKANQLNPTCLARTQANLVPSYPLPIQTTLLKCQIPV